MTDPAGPSGPSGPTGAPATSDALGGSTWVIVSIDGQPIAGGDDVTVTFGHDGRVSGSTGVNRFTASYAMSSGYLTVGPMATTRRAGDPELMAQEQRIVASLAGMCSFDLQERRLAIEGPMGWVELEAIVPPSRARPTVAGAGGEEPISPSA
jgi:heat shock protein HslJ